MKSQTALVARMCRLNEWARMVHDCKNRPAGMSVDEWCELNSITRKCRSQNFEISYLLYILSRKDLGWKYENEWRYVDYSYENQKREKGIKCKLFKIKAVYLGMNCNTEKRNKILELAKNHKFDVYDMQKAAMD